MVLGEVRISQIITTFGPGALIDLKDTSVIALGVDYWISELSNENNEINDKSLIINDPRLLKLFHSLGFDKLKGFIQLVPNSRYNKQKGIKELKNQNYPVRVFPKMGFCPKCRKLDFLNSLRLKRKDNGVELKWYDTPYFCKDCYQNDLEDSENVKLIPARFITMCSNGHVNDFPWKYWLHFPEEPCKNSKLEFYTHGRSAELEDMHVKCIKCKKERNLGKIFDKTEMTPEPPKAIIGKA